MKMKFHSVALLLISMPLTFSALASAAQPAKMSAPSFAEFDRRAQAGERLSVVFFGASLTWGANASDPQLTSYRVEMARRFEAAYPRAHFQFWDAAIGGTGSQLGAFRFERDVKQRQPDLMLLDFSLNDDLTGHDQERLASYESIVRRAITEANCPVEMVFFPGAREVRHPEIALARVAAHREIARFYNAATSDAIALMRQQVQDGAFTVEQLWPSATDQTHPGDAGYKLYAQAAWDSYQRAVAQKLVCHAPTAMLHAPTYMNVARVRLSSLGAPPLGWSVGRPNRISAWYDALMSRWLDDETIAARGQTPDAAQPAPFAVHFRGSMALLFGESTLQSGKYRVTIDGQPSAFKDGDEAGVFNASGVGFGGNMHHVRVVAQGLDPTATHTLEIQPLLEPGQELRLESVCVAGRDGAQVTKNESQRA